MVRSGSYQSILVRSEPPGATIVVDGKEVGHTPRYVLVRNRVHPKIELRYGSTEQEVSLETKYQLKDSFFSNLVFLYYAPVGWGLDLLTGKAWSIQDTPVIEIKKLSARPLSVPETKGPLRIAIAPPKADSIFISDSSANGVERQIPTLIRNVSVQTYESTLPLFLSHGYDFDTPISEKRRRDLYFALGVDAIYESEVEVHSNYMVLTGRLRNVYTGELSTPQQLKTYSLDEDRRRSFLNQLYHRLIPNNFGLDLVTDYLQVKQGTQTYSLQPAPESLWWEQGLQYITAIDISSLPARRESHAFRGLWGFVPSLRFSRKKVFLAGASGEDQQTFTRLFVSTGYGIEGGVQVQRHYFYADVIPIYYWSQIAWQKSGQDFSTTDTGIGAELEFGYLYFISSHWNARLFTRSVTEDSSGWAEALSSSLSKANGDIAVTTQMLGLTIAYRFDFELGRVWNNNEVWVPKSAN